MTKRVLITGGTGLIGRQLIPALLNKGYAVNLLSRKTIRREDVKSFRWDVVEGKIDDACLDDVEAIIHLAGEGIAEKPWTKQRKKDIISSRTDSIKLIYQLMESRAHQVGTIVSASGVGYYGNRGEELLLEDSNPGTDFLAESCIAWEKAVDAGEALGLRVVKLRTGVVLSAEGGALPKLAGPVKLGLGAPLGSGKQWTPWLHIDDMVNMYLFALENEGVSGAYNACTPVAVTNKDLSQEIAKALGKPFFLPAVPSFALRIVLGEMSAVVLNSTKAAPEKLISAGYTFKYESLKEALKAIYAK